MGDSLLVVGDEDRIKVHIHTNNPGHAIELALKHGELTNIKIDNMKEQHRRQMDYQQEGNIEESNTNKEIESLEYAFIAVVSGEGIEQIYKDLGVTSTIKGGQTMNPSTEDFLNEINKINANQIYILPNNSNILLAANQAKKISNKKIEVIPSKTIPQGISALLAFSPEEAHKDNLQNMHNAIKDVKTGQITFAVRDTQVNNIKIETDDIIGIYDGNIIVAGKDINDVALQLINEMVDEEDELITIFSGEEVSKEQVAQLQSKVENSYADVDLEVHYGGQPLYYYIIAVE
jgi:DAK2 domain fusion protein YloV